MHEGQVEWREARLHDEDAKSDMACPPHSFLLIVYYSSFTPHSLIRLWGASREANIALLEAVNRQGEMFLIHTELEFGHTPCMSDLSEP